MKKIIAGTMLAALMAVSGCSSVTAAEKADIDKAFTAEAAIAAGGETFSGQLCRTGENCWTLTMKEPFALQGMTVTFEDGKTTFSMLGFECEADFSDSAVSVLKMLAEAYEAAIDNEGGFENGVLEATNENGAFSVILDESGMPGIINAGGISVKLSQWSESAVTQTQSDELILLE